MHDPLAECRAEVEKAESEADDQYQLRRKAEAEVERLRKQVEDYRRVRFSEQDPEPYDSR